MGSSHSNERLEMPLYAQSPGVLATAHGSVAPQFTSLCIKHTSSWGSTLQVTDAHTQQHVFDFKSASLSCRRTLQTPDGRPLMSIKSKNFSSSYRVYEAGEKDAVSFEIRVEGFARLVIYADFRDRLTGRMCRIFLDGNSYDRVAIFYVEYGTPDLPPKPRRDDVENSKRFQAVARIRRPHGKAFAHQEHFVEAAPGVDITLLLLMWRVRHQIEQDRQAASSA